MRPLVWTMIASLCYGAIAVAAAVAAEPPITDIALCGEEVVACSQVGLSVFDRQSLAANRLVSLPFLAPHDLALSPDGNALLVGGGDPGVSGSVALYDWPGSELQREFGDHADVVMSVCWLADNQLAAGSLDGTIEVWQIDPLQKIHTLRGHSRGVLALAAIDQGRVMVSGGIDRSLRVWDVRSGEQLYAMTQHTQTINALATKPAADGESGLPIIASGGGDRTVRFWQPTIGRMVRFARLPAPVQSLVWADSGSQVVAVTLDGRFYRVDADTVEISGPFAAADGDVYALELDPQAGGIVIPDRGSLRRIPVIYTP